MTTTQSQSTGEGSDRRTVFRPDQVHAAAFIAATAVVLGDVTIGEASSIWFGAVVRGDSEKIQIGRRTNVQDGCVLHADPGFPCSLGDGVTLGHGAIVHGAQVDDDVMIGMRAVVMNGARIGRESLIGVGAVVTEGMVVPPRSLVLGLPGKIARAIDERQIELIHHAAAHYVQAAKEYLANREQSSA